MVADSYCMLRSMKSNRSSVPNSGRGLWYSYRSNIADGIGVSKSIQRIGLRFSSLVG